MHPSAPERHVIQRLASLRSNLVELMFIAVLLGLGVGLAASSLCAMFAGAEVWGLVLGIFVSTVTFLYLFLKVLSPKAELFTIEGFLHLRESEKNVEVHPVDRYELSENVSHYLRAAFSENPALLRAWLNNPVRWLLRQSITADQLTGNSLLNQAVEYFFLDCLSLHLSAYFQEQEIEEEECRKFARADIPDVLLQNRFLEMFSKPMEEREQFADRDLGNSNLEGAEVRVVMAFGRDGALFDMFELILPNGSNVFRSSAGIIRIETAIFTLEFDSGIDGFAANTPRGFEEFYMVDPDLTSRPPLLVKSEIKVTVKRRALFSSKGWEYYRWLDSFISEYYSKANGEEFLKSIGWEAIATPSIFLEPETISARIKSS